MTYTAFDPALPDASSQNGTQFAQATRDNMKALRDAYIPQNLCFQGLRRVKLPLLPHKGEEAHLNPRRGFRRGRIEQIGFDCQGLAIEGRAHPHVGDGAPLRARSLIPGACDVDAVTGQQFILRREIQGRHRFPRADAEALDHRPFESKRRGHHAAGL